MNWHFDLQMNTNISSKNDCIINIKHHENKSEYMALNHPVSS